MQHLIRQAEHLGEIFKQQDTHDYTDRRRGYGHDLSYTPLEDGLRLNAMGHGYGIKVGDRIILSGKDDPKDTCCYTVETIEYANDPKDMWFAMLKFTARTMKQKEADHKLIGLL